MKITKVDIERFSVPLAEPFRVAFGLLTDSDNWIIRVHTDEGITGLGSAAPLAFVTGETMDTCRLVLELFAEAFIGFDPPLYYSTAIYYNKSAYRTRLLQDFLNVARELAQEAP